jgi:hypothetical protein
MDGDANRASRWLWPGILAVVLLAAAALRLPPIVAGYPYLAYVDEGHVLRPAQKQIATGIWNPEENHYPQLPSRTIAVAARLAAAVASPFRDEPMLASIGRSSGFYDVIDPPELLLVGRLLSVLAALGAVLIAGFYARRLAGIGAGAVAAAAMALVPALVLRGSIVIVDAYTTLFALGALAIASSVSVPRQWLRVALAGACCGLAAVSKYPAGLVGIAVVVQLVLLPWSWPQRLARAAVAALAGGLAAVVAMPSLATQGVTIWRRLLLERQGYSTNHSVTYWDQAVRRAEWDLHFERPEVGWVFLALALAGSAVAVAVPRWRRDGVAWGVFTLTMVGFHASYAFQPFRHLLPVVAIGCVAVGVLAGWLGERLRRPVLVPAAAIVLLVALYAPGDAAYAAERARLRDTRSQAVDWLLRHREPAQSVLVMRQVAIAPLDLQRLGPKVELGWWEDEARPRAMRAEPRFLVVTPLVRPDGSELFPGADAEWLLRSYQVRAQLGTEAMNTTGVTYPDNRLHIYVLERRPGARRSFKDATSAATGANSSSGKFSPLSQNSPSPPAPHDS